MARVLFFGRLRDLAGCAARDVAIDEQVGLAEIRRLAAAGDADLEMALSAPEIRIALNAEMTARSAAPCILPHDEVAFMPPFSGG